MVNAGRDITAVLKLNATGFNEGLTEAESKLTAFKSKFESETKAINSALDKLPLIVDRVSQALEHMNNIANLSEFSKLSKSINQIGNGLKVLSSEEVDVVKSTTILNNMFRAFQGSLNGTEVVVKGVSASVKELITTERSGVSTTQQWNSAQAHSGRSAREVAMEIRQRLDAQRQLTSSTQQLTGSENQLQAEANQTAVAQEKVANSSNKASASMNKQASATRGLGKALSSLRMMGTMVGSMIAYNFIHNLAMATTETINAKSEMNGYFQMLGYTTRQTEHFNKALDKTVQKFPRLNKYALGETISSIGVEFELTTKEMEKAMPVVSMITSEYLRAGRNVNEASLAVKDILQGEFQRLSRETGVKGDQLKEAGWSGDKSDVMGLLEALEKVGKERNWDTFVQKANSLNDAVLITQNRFSEWSADMVERVQPAILNVFNTIMIVAQDFAKVINEALDWLSGDGIGQSIVKWGGLATAIGLVGTALIHYRTGANLTQIAQMGLTRSIGATILGLEAETVAEYGLRTSIVANITQMEAEEVKRQGRLNSIFATITGLKAEEVAEMGKARALASSLLGLDMATVKEYGFLTALGSATTGIEIQEFKLKSHRVQLLLTAGSVTALAGAMLILTGYFVVQAMKINDSIEKYNKFRNTLEHGDEIVKEHKDTVENLTEKQEKLNEKLQTLDKSSYEYALTQNKLKTVTDELSVANQNYTDSVNAVAWAKHKQELYDTEKQEKSLQTQKEINQALIDYGVSVKDANEIASPIWSDTIDGWNQQYETLQRVNLQQEKNAISIKYHLDELNKKHIDPKEAQILIKPLIKSGNKIADAKEELGQATSLTEYVDKWLWLQVAQIQHSIDEFNFNIHVDWTKAIEGIFKGIGYGYDSLNLPMPSLVDWIIESLGWSDDKLELETVPNIGGVLTTLFETYLVPQIDQALKSVSDFFNGKTLMELLGLDSNKDYIGDFVKWLSDSFWNGVNGFIDSLTGGGEESTGSGALGMKKINVGSILAGIIDFASGIDISWLTNWVNNTIVIPLTNFASDPIGTLSSWGLPLPQINLGSIIQGLFNIGGEGGFDIGGWLASIFNIDTIVSTFTNNLNIIFITASTIASNVSMVFSNLKNMIWGHIQGILSNVTSTFTNIKNTAVNQINGLSSGIKGGIDKVVNAFNYMKDAILNSAKAIYDGVRAKFDSVKNTIGDFWHKLTNPSSWGSAGSESYQRRSPKPQTARRMFAGSPVVRSAIHHGAGVNPYQNDSQSVKLKDLMGMIDGDNKVKLSDFLAMFSEGGFGTWDFHEPAKKRIFDTAKNYKTGSPSIKGIGTVGDGYKVEKFWDGEPKFAFEEFQAVARAIFSAIPYKFYYDSEWKGSWVNALLSGAVNCSDGAEALIALARVFGFDGYKVHTTLKSGVGHFFARINGVNMDTTNFQNHGSWSPLGGAGIPTRTASHIGRAGETQGKTVNITVSMDNAVIYGVDDLDSRIQDSVQKGIQSEFNDPYTIAI